MDYKLSFITPTFLSGADQNKPEIRAASIRGALRWWYRILWEDCSLEEESKVFGSVHGTVRSSAVIVRVKDENIVKGQTLGILNNTDFGYLGYFAQVSGNNNGIYRTTEGHYLAPESSFTLSISYVSPLEKKLQERFEKTVEVFCRLGTLGLRASRGFGAVTEEKEQTQEEFLEWIKTLPETISVYHCDGGSMKLPQHWKDCLEKLGVTLKEMRRNYKGQETSLGFSERNRRQMSALRLRPVKVKGGILPILVYSDVASRARSVKDGLGQFLTELKA